MQRLLLFAFLMAGALAQQYQCGLQANNKPCAEGYCCSVWGYCLLLDNCTPRDCQSQCPPLPEPPATPAAEFLSESLFEKMFPNRNNRRCEARTLYPGGFYSYRAFMWATAEVQFQKFANEGDDDVRKREIAAFLAQTSHVTSGRPPNYPRKTWGYCWVRQPNRAPNEEYYGRGPFQIQNQNNYEQAAAYIGVEGIRDYPDMVAKAPVLSFRTALWVWMGKQEQANLATCHQAMLTQNSWPPFRGFGATTNILNSSECGHGKNVYGEDRIGFYKRYCDLLNVTYGDNVDCYDLKPVLPSCFTASLK